MAIRIDNKVFRNLQQQVDYLTELVNQGVDVVKNVKGIVANASQLPDASSVAIGTTYAVGTSKPYEYYVALNGRWVDLGEFPYQGPVGPTGPAGPAGGGGGTSTIGWSLVLVSTFATDTYINSATPIVKNGISSTISFSNMLQTLTEYKNDGTSSSQSYSSVMGQIDYTPSTNCQYIVLEVSDK